VASYLHIARAEEDGMRSLFVRWSVAVIVGSLWGAVAPPARPRAERPSSSEREKMSVQRVTHELPGR
jgi:hypothetical protein